jgi:hypothetical protein
LNNEYILKNERQECTKALFGSNNGRGRENGEDKGANVSLVLNILV